MTQAIERVFEYMPRILDQKKVCSACKDKSKRRECSFSQKSIYGGKSHGHTRRVCQRNPNRLHGVRHDHRPSVLCSALAITSAFSAPSTAPTAVKTAISTVLVNRKQPSTFGDFGRI